MPRLQIAAPIQSTQRLAMPSGHRPWHKAALQSSDISAMDGICTSGQKAAVLMVAFSWATFLGRRHLDKIGESWH